MNFDNYLIYIGVIFPLTFSPGPANMMTAAFGTRFSYKKIFPFIAGVSTIVFLQSMIVGYGAAEVIYNNLTLVKYIKFVGAFYIIYLAYKFIRTSRTDKIDKIEQTPKFLDGVILQFLNIKVLAFLLAIFPQFIVIDQAKSDQVLQLSLGLSIMVIASLTAWALGGDWISKKFLAQKSINIQGYIFGGMLIIVAIWMVL